MGYFKRFIILVVLLCAVLIISGCGSAPSSFATEEILNTSNVSEIKLFSDKYQVKTDNIDYASITVMAINGTGGPVDNASFYISTDEGILSGSQVLTDSSGVATFTVKGVPGTPDGESTIRVIDSVTNKEATISITYYGNEINITPNKNSAKLGESVGLSIDLKGANGSSIPNQNITLTTDVGLLTCGDTTSNNLTIISKNSPIECTISSANSGTGKVTVSGLGVTDSTTILFSDNFFDFVNIQNEDELLTEKSYLIKFKYVDINGNPTGKDLAFSTSLGSLSEDNITFSDNKIILSDKNSDGIYEFYIKSGYPSKGVISAKSEEDNLTSSIQVNFVSGNLPDRIILNADKTVTSPDSDGITITAKVIDANGYPLANKDVTFELSKPAGGGDYISPTTTKTEYSGEAQTKYIPGSSSSALDGVEVTAKAGDKSEKIYLTVSNIPTNVQIGTGNMIEILDDTKYKKGFSVLVTDSNGSPINGAQITLSVLPLEYYYVDSDNNIVNRANEDINYNGILDSGEDVNGNGQLDPGNVATISEGKYIITNENGFADFSLIYNKCYATWVRVRIKASANVEGTEGSDFYDYILTFAASDASNMPCSSPFQP
jgi:hypothetical protein